MLLSRGILGLTLYTLFLSFYLLLLFVAISFFVKIFIHQVAFSLLLVLWYLHLTFFLCCIQVSLTWYIKNNGLIRNPPQINLLLNIYIVISNQGALSEDIVDSLNIELDGRNIRCEYNTKRLVGCFQGEIYLFINCI